MRSLMLSGGDPGDVLVRSAKATLWFVGVCLCGPLVSSLFDLLGRFWFIAICATYFLAVAVPVYGAYIFTGDKLGLSSWVEGLPWLGLVLSILFCTAWVPRATRRAAQDR